MYMVKVELIIVRHGYSCQNAWKSIDQRDEREPEKRINGYYPDPELTSEGIRLCESRRNSLSKVIQKRFPDKSYTVATSCLARTQQTAYYMLLKGTRQRYSIFPHVAEDADKRYNYPLECKEQQELLGPVVKHLYRDERGLVESDTKSNWSLFLKWITSLSDKDREDLFYKTKDGVYRTVLFTHYQLIEHALGEKIKPANNDVFLMNIDTDYPGAMTYEHLVKNKPVKSESVEGCRIADYADFIEMYASSSTSPSIRKHTSRKVKKVKKSHKKTRNNH